MAVLILGLVLFLGVHSIRIFANDWRNRQIARLGEKGWKGLYTLVSIAGFALIIWGFGMARQQPVLLYMPPMWLRHLNALFTLVAFILVVAAYAPGNHFKARLGHPMLAGVKTWAFGHLLATGMLHDVVLFGAFLLWAVVDFISARRRDRAAGVTYPAGTMKGDVIVVVAGVVVWAVFAFWLHGWLIGVKPMG
ncbi:NnrU family protein [Dyella jiangningensis]|uniref:NnrU family protein n=1 Tax=Dyella jiangningensis TaxID=1379159 RepID=A0A328P5Q9_9GAMM|nr:NnrU family protein [Dyella jiangningensis]RAO76663.1 NnrU family protein [Dyella jiangningensis]